MGLYSTCTPTTEQLRSSRFQHRQGGVSKLIARPLANDGVRTHVHVEQGRTEVGAGQAYGHLCVGKILLARREEAAGQQPIHCMAQLSTSFCGQLG